VVIDLQTAPWRDVAGSTAVLVLSIGGFWWMIRFFERVAVESVQSRNTQRRFMRWQRTLFRGRYPFGRGTSPSTVAWVRFTCRTMRAILVVMALLYLLALVMRLAK